MNKLTWIRFVLVLAVCFQLLPPLVAEGKINGTVSGETGGKLDQYLTRLSRFGFSGSILVSRQGKVLLHKSYGWADKQQGIPNTNDTAFDIASLTKQFTAAAILKLEAQGKLKTSDPISRHLPNVPADKAGIAIHHLLTHTSGFDPDFTEGKNITREQFIAGMMKMPLVAETGKEYIYANSGYCLLAAIVEIVSGQPYNKFVVEQLYKPAGMTGTGSYDDPDRWRNRV
ncbi:MAG TPA: serine hydrolase domain-containing protein, partial [Blastocatellia bacterium]